MLRCIAEIGFEPNNAARSLKRGRVSSIGLIVPDLGNPFFAAIAEGVEMAVSDADVLLVLCITWADIEREEYYAKVLRSQRLSGVIYLSGSGLPSPSLLQLARRGSVIFVDERLPGVEVPFVSATNRAGARAVASHVLDAGHKNIAIVAGPERLWTSEQRLAGYREAIIGAGLNPDQLRQVNGDYSEQSGYEAGKRLLSDASARPSAVLCANDLMAMGVIRYCRQIDVPIPGELSVTGFDDIPSSECLDPPLTTVAQPGREMGYAAAQLLLHKVGFNTEPPDQTEFKTVPRFRRSVGAPFPGP